ncbi:UDP-galactose translocator, partial [Caligus rogercresseyi]
MNSQKPISESSLPSPVTAMGDNNLRTLKYVSLITLTGQNALLGLSMRYGRTRSGDMFFESTAVLMAEVVKMITCLWLVFNGEAGRNLGAWKRSLWDTIVINWADTLKVCIPSLIYLLQNTLLYTAAENLDLSDAKETSSVSGEQNRVKGFMAATTATVLSGFAGIYFEKILKGSDVSVWMRNVQLSMLSIPLGIFTAFVRHGDDIASKGFFFGYDLYVIYLVVLNATGGLL